MRGRGLGFAFAWLLVAWPGYTYSDGEASREYAEAIRRAVLENPQVNLEWHRFSASQQAQNCLLYTSPSPRDKRQSRMPSSA